MKKSRILIVVAVMLCTILVFSACKKSEPENTSNDEAQNIVGVVQDGGSMHDIYITDSTGTTYLFGIGDDTVVDSGAVDVGSEVKIHYLGSLDSAGNMQQVQVQRIELMKAAKETAPAASTPEPKPAPAPAPSEPESGADSGLPADASKEMQATVDQVNGDGTFFAADATGVDYCFSLDGVVVDSSSGSVSEGDSITIYYTGPIEATDKVQSKITISKIVVN